jgi:hypothetical protein
MKHHFLFLAIILVLVSCNPFAPSLTDKESNNSKITQQKTPRDVLTNFRYAYVFKDSLVYSDVLDSSFQFISKNYGTSPPTNINWGRDVDIRTTTRLFRHFDVLELDWGSNLSKDTNIMEGDTLLSEMKITFQLTLDGGREIPTIKGEALFNFLKNSDGVWKITRWEDLSSF